MQLPRETFAVIKGVFVFVPFVSSSKSMAACLPWAFLRSADCAVDVGKRDKYPGYTLFSGRDSFEKNITIYMGAYLGIPCGSCLSHCKRSLGYAFPTAHQAHHRRCDHSGKAYASALAFGGHPFDRAWKVYFHLHKGIPV